MPTEPEYRTFQDYIFRYLVREGGRLHLPVHIHSAIGIGDYFSLSQGNIFNLEDVLRDPRYSATTFVMIHGGYPYEREAIWLAAVRNVYMDSSLMEIAMYLRSSRNRGRYGWRHFQTKSLSAPIASLITKSWAQKKATGWGCSPRGWPWLPRLPK